ncbi:MAG: ABC transporter permease [Acidisphaera sp.]|nr:ABC transporter permease [Acidisphaera sp.]MBV9813628.1 ABC transporter permease [Acetobacteraceae bacterium]
MKVVNVTALTLIMAFVLAPTLIVIAMSFGDNAILQFPPHRLSLRWYAAALARPEFRAAAWTSLWLAITATAIATPIALAAAVALVRGRFPGKAAMQTLLMAPLFVPGVVISLSLLVVSSAVGFRNGDLRLIGAHALVVMPFLLRTIIAGLSRADIMLEEAARTLGASRGRSFLLVTLPGLGGALLAGALFAFVISFDNVSVSLFLASAKSNTLPLAVMSYVEFNADPSIAAVSTLLIAMAMLAAFVLERSVGLRDALSK